MVISVVDRLKVYQHLEAAPKHALAVEGQLFRIHHAGEALVLHHLGIDAVALGARLVDDVGKETVSPAFCFTARGNEVRLPTLTSSARHSRNSSAPCSRHTFP